MKKEKEKEIRNTPQNFLSGALSLTLSAIIVKLIGLIYKIPIASLLGDEGMGYFNSAYTVFAFFYLLCTAGVPKAVMILISESKSKGHVADEKKILRVASAMFIAVGAIATTLFIVFAVPIANLIGSSKSYATMIAIAPSIVLVSLSGVIRGYLSANMRLIDISISQVIEGVGKLVLGLVFAMVGFSIQLPIEILSAFTILGVSFGALLGLIYLLVCTKINLAIDNSRQISPILENRQIIRRILSISIPITLSAAIMSITNIIDLGLIIRSLIESGLKDIEANALYGNYTTLAVPMLNLAMAVISPISIAYLPVFTKCCVTADNKGLMKTQRSAIELTAFMAAPIMIGLMTFSKEILALLFPKSGIIVGSKLLFLIAPSILFSSVLLIINTILEAKGMVKAPLISMSIGGIIKIASSYFLIANTNLGILGAPVGTVLSYAAALFVSIIIYTIAIKSYIPIFTASFLPYLIAAVSVMISRFVFDKLKFCMSDNLSLLISIMLAALIYLGISMVLGVLGKSKIRELAKYTKVTEQI